MLNSLELAEKCPDGLEKPLSTAHLDRIKKGLGGFTQVLDTYGTPGRIRTCGLRIRSSSPC